MKLYKIIFITILFATLNCKEKKIISYDDSSAITIYCENCSEEIKGEIPNYKKVNFIPLETTAACLINAIQQVVIKDSFIYVSDNDRYLYAFNKQGKFIRRIGSMGHGPTEYIILTTFYIDHINNNIVIFDGYRKKIIKFDLTGKYLSYEEFTSDVYLEAVKKAILTENNKLLLYNSINFQDNMAYTLMDMKNNELIGNYFSYFPIKLDNMEYNFAINPMSITKEGISFIRPLNDTIYQYNNSKFSAKYVIQTPAKILPLSEISLTSSSYHEIRNKIKDKGYFTGFKGIFETSNHLILRYTNKDAKECYFFADKNTKKGYYHILKYPTQKDKIPFFPLLTSHENSFISVVEPRNLLFRKYEFNDNDETGKKFQTMLENLDEQDNPVLFVYEFD